MNDDSRQRIISRRVLTPKGDDEGGGGGDDAGAGDAAEGLPRRSRSGSARSTTDASGHATRDVKLPESLTTYRIMAVAGDTRVALRIGRRARSASTSRSR